MASEILGLFGGQTPQQLRNAYLDSMMVSPAQMGSQSLLQQVVSMGQNAGSAIGVGLGGLLGGKVAGEVEAAYLDDAIKSASAVKGTPAEKMQAVADYLADKPGMGAQYMKAMEEANRLKAQGLQLEEAEFKAKNRTRENKETRMVFNPLTQQDEPKTFYWTEEWKDGKWVQKTMPTATPTKPTEGTTGGMPGWDKDAIRKQIEANEAAAAAAKQGQTPPPSTEDLKNLATVDPAKYAEELRRQEAAAGEAARAELNKPKDYSNEGRNNQRMVFSSEADKQKAATRAWAEGRMKDFQIISQAIVVPRK